MAKPRSQPNRRITEVTFDYKRSNQSRVIHVDGVWGGSTVHGGILMALFSERQAIPDQSTYKVRANGRLGEELASAAAPRLVRDIEVEAIMNLATARELYNWLGEKIDALVKARKSEPA